MDTKNWAIPLITGFIGVFGSLGGAAVSGYYQERTAFQQAQLELTKISTTDKSSKLKELKDASVRYIIANGEFVRAAAYFPRNEADLSARLIKVQTVGTEIILIADDELAQYTNTVNHQSALVSANVDPNKLDNEIRMLASMQAEWIKKVRLSLDVISK